MSPEETNKLEATEENTEGTISWILGILYVGFIDNKTNMVDLSL